MDKLKEKITSERTSRNVLNPIYKQIVSEYDKGTSVLDWGCGKYHKNEDYCKKNDLEWHGYDPYCRSKESNEETYEYISHYNPDVVVCSNVLNVVDDETIPSILNSVYSAAGNDTDIYFVIWEKNKNGIHEITRDGYQRNERTIDYLGWLKDFDVSSIKGNVIKCRKKAIA